MAMVPERTVGGVAVVHVDGPLRAPVSAELRETVETILQRGHRQLIVDLALVADLDAAGVGELVHVYKLTVSHTGRLRLSRPTARAREILDRAGLLGLLSW
jgi:anti-anti-sigma factor